MRGRSQGLTIRNADFRYVLEHVREGKAETIRKLFDEPLVLRIKACSIVPRTWQQKAYLQAIRNHAVAFGIGPAGTGKTFLAMAAALQALVNQEVERVVLTRPAVEAGETLGFLPGDLSEKIQPYLRPLYDALFAILGQEAGQKFIEQGVIEIAPLAYMRGRTLNQAFVILDEAQNTTPEQMMMFLTRLGEDSRMVVTGDLTQIDLPADRESGLRQAYRVLVNTPEIAFTFFDKTDVVRHLVVERILDAYEAFQAKVSPD